MKPQTRMQLLILIAFSMVVYIDLTNKPQELYTIPVMILVYTISWLINNWNDEN